MPTPTLAQRRLWMHPETDETNESRQGRATVEVDSEGAGDGGVAGDDFTKEQGRYERGSWHRY